MTNIIKEANQIRIDGVYKLRCLFSDGETRDILHWDPDVDLDVSSSDFIGMTEGEAEDYLVEIYEEQLDEAYVYSDEIYS